MPGVTGEYLLDFAGPHGQAGRAHVRVWRQGPSYTFDPTGDNLLAVVTAIDGAAAAQLDLPEATISIQPAAEQLAGQIVAAYSVHPFNLIYIEHWTPRGARVGDRWQFAETWYRVRLHWSRSRGFQARGGADWQAITRADVEQLIGGPWDDDLDR